jgi:hypothetical protein
MNNTFNIKRFGFVFRKDMLENWKRYMFLFLTMLGVIAIVFIGYSLDYYKLVKTIPDMVNHRNINLQLLGFSSLMFAAFGILFASTFMNPMNSKTKRIAFLTSPASNFEKALSRWLIVTVGYVISFFVALWLADALRVGICAARYPGLEVNFLDLSKLIRTNDFEKNCAFDPNVFALALSSYFLVQSIFILGATFWEKAAFVKTFTIGAAIVLVFILVCRWAILLSYGGFGGFENVLESFTVFRKNEISREQAFTVMASVISVFTLTNWTLAFCRIRESEIIKRL